MQYPHWLMVAGAVLIVIRFIGFAFRKDNAASDESDAKQTSPTDEPSLPLPTRNAEWSPPSAEELAGLPLTPERRVSQPR